MKLNDTDRELFRRLGRVGGKTAARRMTKKERAERARKGGEAAARRRKERKQ